MPPSEPDPEVHRPGATSHAREQTRAALDAQWDALERAESPEAFYAAWLALQCQQIPDVTGGLLLVGPGDRGPYAPVAVWPRVHGDVVALTELAERSIRERRPLAAATGRGGGRRGARLARPLALDDAVVGAVVLDLAPMDRAAIEATERRLAWGTAWIQAHLRRRLGRDAEEGRARLHSVLDLVAGAIESSSHDEANHRLAGDLATRLSCTRVSLGVVHEDRVTVAAVSSNAQFEERSNLLRAVEAAMEEASLQERVILWPDADPDADQIVRAHATLARSPGSGSICSAPLAHAGEVTGVLTLERDAERPFDTNETALVDAVAALVGPVLHLARRDDRSLATTLREGLRDEGRRLLSRDHNGRKLALVGAIAGLLFAAFATGDYRVTARAVLEPALQRAGVAPFDGYLAEAPVRAGDRVKEGDLLARLDDKDLELERRRWQSEVSQRTHQYRQAMVERDAGQVRILAAAMDEARARLDLVERQLERTQLRAAFDGFVVSGDHSQSLGAPVERGAVLFEVAPLEDWRLVLDVDESDVRAVEVGQRGDLILAAMPNHALPFVVRALTPVSETRDGRNTFRVEASFDGAPGRLRPGMEGIGKIDVGERRRIWIWTHDAVEWLKLALWRWLP